MLTPTTEYHWLGIDVSKDRLDVYDLNQSVSSSYDNDSEGVASLWQALRSRSDWAVVYEASGGYETRVATTLAAHGCRVSVVNPRQVRDFAKASGTLAKTLTGDNIAKRLAASRIGLGVRAENRGVCGV